MSSTTWIQSGLLSRNIQPINAVFWRCVQPQDRNNRNDSRPYTRRLVDTEGEQSVLGTLIEETKPSIPEECKHLHYLYKTPFRYGLSPKTSKGSRFLKPGQPGVFYASAMSETAVVEVAFHKLLLFYLNSPATPRPKVPTKRTVFSVPVESKYSVDLTTAPFDKYSKLWMQASDYRDCQRLKNLAEAQGIQLIKYNSVRDPEKGRYNVVILHCSAFKADLAIHKPQRLQAWYMHFSEKGIFVGRNKNRMKKSRFVSYRSWAAVDNRIDVAKLQ